MAIAMARSDARMRLLDASLVAAINHHAEAFGLDFKGWCAANNVSRSTAYRHKKRIEELGRWEPLSTRPKSRPDHQTPPEVEAEILQLRREPQEQSAKTAGPTMFATTCSRSPNSTTGPLAVGGCRPGP